MSKISNLCCEMRNETAAADGGVVEKRDTKDVHTKLDRRADSV